MPRMLSFLASADIHGGYSGLENFWLIVSKPDNIPIVMMVLLVGFSTWLSFSEAGKNDRRKDNRGHQPCERVTKS